FLLIRRHPISTLFPYTTLFRSELMEWAILFEVVRERDFATDTVIVRDGFLRSKVFSGDLFKKYRQGIDDAIATQFSKHRRRIFRSEEHTSELQSRGHLVCRLLL